MQDLTELTAWPYRNDLLISGSDLKISQITDLSPPKYSFRSDLRKVVAVTWDSFVLDGACWSKDNFVELLQPRCIILLVLGLSLAPVLKDLWPMFQIVKGRVLVLRCRPVLYFPLWSSITPQTPCKRQVQLGGKSRGLTKTCERGGRQLENWTRPFQLSIISIYSVSAV